MKTTILKFAFLATVIGTLTFSSCKKNPTPTPEDAQEEYDASRIQFVLLNPEGSETTDTTTIDFNRNGVAAPNTAMLMSNKHYRMLITLLNHGNSVNDEVLEEGTIHQFFFIASQNNVFDYAYNDFDVNSRGIGLDGTAIISGPGTTQLKVVLRHGLDKSKPEAQSWNSTSYENAGGEDDLNISFQITAQ